jgi:hypothetical protein
MSRFVIIFPQVNPFDPWFMMSHHITSEVAFNPFVDYLYLAIHLGVINGTRCHGCTYYIEEILPESSHETAITVTHYGFGKPMQFENFPEE